MAKRRGNSEGSIFQRSDGMWVAAITTPEGRKRRYSKSRKVVQGHLLEMQNALRGGLPEAKRSLTVEVLCAEYLKHKSTSWQPRTQGIAEGVIRLHIVPRLGTTKLSALTVQVVEGWLRGLGQTRTAQIARGHLSAACDLAMRYDWMTRNPVKMTDAPKVSASRPKDLSRDDIRAILDAAESPPPLSPKYAKSTDTDYYPIVAVLLGCGLRIGECLALRWEDWDHEARNLKIRHSLGRVGPNSSTGDFALRSPKTSSGIRSLVAPVFVAEALQRVRRKDGELGLIFCTATGNPLASGNVRRGVTRVLARSGIEGIGLHHLRHAHASLLLDDGMPLPIVASVLGHADAAVTARVYAHKLKGTHERVASAMDEMLGKKN